MGFGFATVHEEPAEAYSGNTAPYVREGAGNVAGEGAAADDLAEELGDRIATLAAHIHAATSRLLVLLARFDRMGGWVPGGHRSCAHWLSYRTGYDLGTAREHVRVARALEHLPLTVASMSSGELSFSKVRALTRVADPAGESDLLELAKGCTTAQLELMVRAWKKGDRADEQALERERHATRSLSVFPDDEGMYVIEGRLPAEVGAVLIRAIDAAGDVLYRERDEVVDRERDIESDRVSEGRRGRKARLRVDADSGRAAARRRADALGLIAERALDAGIDGPDHRSRAGRYQVVLHVEAPTLERDGDPGRSDLEDGTRVSAETSRRLSCDAGLVRVSHAEDGSVLDVGRKTRAISPALRRALAVRDRGCRFPGCGSRFTEAHHVVHWADGGGTNLENTLLLCRFHHRLVHEDGWTVEWWGAGRPAFRDPAGSAHYAPGTARLAAGGTAGRAAERTAGRTAGQATGPTGAQAARRARPKLEQLNGRLGIDPDPLAATARWRRESDIPDGVRFRALEAGLAAGPRSGR